MPLPTGSLEEILVNGHPCDVFEPAHAPAAGIAAVYLHDRSETRLCDQPELVDLCADHHLRVIAPRTGRSWWSNCIVSEFDSQLTTEQYVLDHVIPLVHQRWNIEPPRIGLFGSEMGGQGALRFAYKHPRTFPTVAAVSPTIDYQFLFDEEPALQAMYRDAEQARQDTALLHAHPLNWPRHQFFCCSPADYPWWDSADRLHMKLASTGIPHECDLETSCDDANEYRSRMLQRALDFLSDRLERE